MMPYGPEDARRFNPLIKLDRHAMMWTDMVNSAIKHGRPEQKAIDEANSAINMDITRSRVMSETPGKPQPLQGYDPGFDVRPPGASGSKQGRMTQDQDLPDARIDADKVNIPYGQLPGDEANYQRYKAQQDTTRPPPVPSPVETISERFPAGNVPPPDFETAIKRFEAVDRTKPKGKPIIPGIEERFLDPTKRTI